MEKPQRRNDCKQTAILSQARAQKLTWLPSINVQFKMINARWFVSNAKWFVNPLKTNNKEKDEQLELFE